MKLPLSGALNEHFLPSDGTTVLGNPEFEIIGVVYFVTFIDDFPNTYFQIWPKFSFY